MKLDNHYTDPALTALYDIDSGWSKDRDYYLDLAGSRPMHVLDVGCGTGLLAVAFADAGHQVTGVDPSAAMLAIAKTRNGGDRVAWIEASGAEFQTDERFDLIIMTGHAFQVFLTDEETIAACANIAEHLSPKGRFVFETRNPSIDWAAKWEGDRLLQTPDGDIPMHRNIDEQTKDQISFTTTYHLNDGIRRSISTLRFPELDRVKELLFHAGLSTTKIIGDWEGRPFDGHTMKEMIFHTQRSAATASN